MRLLITSAAIAAACTTAASAASYRCDFGPNRHDYVLVLDQGHERLRTKGKTYPLDVGSEFMTGGDDSGAIGGSFSISTRGPNDPKAIVDLNSGDEKFHGRAVCPRVK